jgi:hypothetical protein
MENTNLKKLVIGGVAALAIGGSIALGAVTVASADPTTSPSPGSPSASSSTSSSTSPTGTRAGRDGRSGPARASQDTPVTGDEATKVSAAVTAKDSSVTVTSVRKDPDGSYDVLGTKDGANVMYDVSADLATVSAAHGGGKGGRGGASKDTVVTGDEATKVTAAVTAKDSAVKVTGVRKDADGSYDVVGTKDTTKVFYEVSADLTTVTARS